MSRPDDIRLFLMGSLRRARYRIEPGRLPTRGLQTDA
jgi:hypothetical protein